MPSTDQAGKAKPRPDPSARDMGIAWTRSGNVSNVREFLDTSPEHVHGVDMFQGKLHVQPVRRSLGGGGFAESAKLEQAIKANLRGLGYGG